MKSDADEKELLKSVECGEWRSAGVGSANGLAPATPRTAATMRSSAD
jgi:hypothetical protein